MLSPEDGGGRMESIFLFRSMLSNSPQPSVYSRQQNRSAIEAKSMEAAPMLKHEKKQKNITHP